MEFETLEFKVADRVLAFVDGDITKFPADAIGNAANSSLVGGSGVNGAILAAGGPKLRAELEELRREIGGCDTGDAVATGAGNLPAKWVLHCVGPVYETGLMGEAALLESCYRAALRLAQFKGAKTVSLPAVSTGVYGYPVEEAADIAVRTVAGILESERCTIERVAFVLFGAEAFRIHVEAARRILA